MKSKSETRQNVVSLISFIETRYYYKVKCIRSNNGPEFSMPQVFASKGIIHYKSCNETTQQNAKMERKHDHILNIHRALL